MLAQQVARDPSGFWLGYALPVVYAAATHAGGAWLLLTRAERSGAHCALAVLAVAHGRVVASYLVHEATHSAVFRSLRANTAYGVFCQWWCAPQRAAAARCCGAVHVLLRRDAACAARASAACVVPRLTFARRRRVCVTSQRGVTLLLLPVRAQAAHRAPLRQS